MPSVEAGDLPLQSATEVKAEAAVTQGTALMLLKRLKFHTPPLPPTWDIQCSFPATGGVSPLWLSTSHRPMGRNVLWAAWLWKHLGCLKAWAEGRLGSAVAESLLYICSQLPFASLWTGVRLTVPGPSNCFKDELCYTYCLRQNKCSIASFDFSLPACVTWWLFPDHSIFISSIAGSLIITYIYWIPIIVPKERQVLRLFSR